MSLPPKYSENIERVTNIVSFVYPFEGTEGERRYLDWLRDKNIDHNEYLSGAQEMGTFVHNYLEDYINGHPLRTGLLMSETHNEIDNGIDWLDNLGYKKIETELYTREKDERFQGSVDLLYTDKDGKTVLADWKTYGIVKKRYDLPNKFIVPTDKRKKVRLQMSFYAYALAQQGINIDRLEILFLHEDGVKVIKLDLIPAEEIEEILLSFIRNKELEEKINSAPIIFNNKSKMQFEIRVPLEAYAYVNVTIDMYKEEEGVTIEQKIDEARGAIKHYLDGRNGG